MSECPPNSKPFCFGGILPQLSVLLVWHFPFCTHVWDVLAPYQHYFDRCVLVFNAFHYCVPEKQLVVHVVENFINMPRCQGGPQRYRPDREAQEWRIELLEASDTEHQFQDQGKRKVTWLFGSKITSCYGCQNKFWESRVTRYHPNPRTLFCAENKSERIFQRVLLASDSLWSLTLHISLEEVLCSEWTLPKIGAHSIAITEDDKRHFKQIHFKKLKQECRVRI